MIILSLSFKFPPAYDMYTPKKQGQRGKAPLKADSRRGTQKSSTAEKAKTVWGRDESSTMHVNAGPIDSNILLISRGNDEHVQGKVAAVPVECSVNASSSKCNDPVIA